MSDILERAMQVAKAAAATGWETTVDEAEQLRAGGELLKKLGAAYYAERHSTGTPEATGHALRAVEAHVSTHGNGVLRSA
ncbi:hypothetical protein [Streptomyces sp. UNOC14_S4]|uniref:hypothetical protein n=1 Tax=Streptomyces sp. UNOC14_S4 TaxID=2872340 RepID=UPI001E2B6D89|nr:hypothetical protein [Streptomyces sp. UNOC14_S4]MCC3767843.1 hypothetical protein [Streptomyces sp. UNOC14_S4]